MRLSRKARLLAVLIVAVATAAGFALFGDSALRRVSFLFASNPVAPTETALARAEALFAEHCAACHGNPAGPGAAGMVIGGQRVPAFGELNRPASVLAMRITFGVGEAMPAWDDVLSEDEIWHLVTYVMTFQRPGGGWRVRQN